MNIHLLRIGRRFVATLLLVVAISHACLPTAPPFERVAGSAFSSSTSDVSIAQARGASIVKRSLPAQPLVPLAARVENGAEVVPTLAVRLTHTMPQAQAPPASSSDFRPLAPRAPPVA